MDNNENFETPARRPVHAGFVIEHLLMPNAKINRKQLAELLDATDAETAHILDGEEPLTDKNVQNLRDIFGAAAENLMRIQMMGEFYDEHRRRPTHEEKQEIFGKPKHFSFSAG